MAETGRSAAALGFGLAYCLAAVALLVQALDLAPVPWRLVVPAILVLCGLVVLLSGMVDGRAGRRSHSTS